MQLKYIIILFLAFAPINIKIQAASIRDFFEWLSGKRLPEEKLREQWFQAVQMGDLKTIHSLISKVDINAKDQNGRTALIIAICAGHEDIVRILMQVRGIDLFDRDNSGKTALVHAIEKNQNKILEILEHKKGHILKELIDRGLAPELFFEKVLGKRVPEEKIFEQWFCEIEMGDFKAIQYLFSRIDINAKNDVGCTALIIAACTGREDIVDFLLQIPALNILDKDNNGKTALMHAIERSHSNIVKMIKYKNKLTLEKLAFSVIKRSCIEELKPYTDDSLKSIIDQIGIENMDSALLDKIFRGNFTEVIKYLFKNSRDPREFIDRFPLECIDPRSEIFKFFLTLAFATLDELTTHDQRGNLPLHNAVMDNDRRKVCEILLNSPFVLIDLPNKNGTDTAIDKAVGKPQILDLLMDLAYADKQTKETAKMSELNKRKLQDGENFCANCSKPAIKRCLRCKQAYYCDAKCQKADWLVHKHNCH